MKKFKKHIPYIIPLFLGIGLIFQIIPFGDYSEGLLTGLFIVFFGGLLIIYFVTYAIYQIWRKNKKKKTPHFFPLIISALFLIIFYSLTQVEEKKFWTSKFLIANIYKKSSTKTPKEANLTLYRNGSFAVSLIYADYSSTYQGRFEIKRDTLKLKRKNLPDLTNSLICSKYLIDKTQNKIIPLINHFDDLEIKKFESN